jgi:hypothetical protein
MQNSLLIKYYSWIKSRYKSIFAITSLFFLLGCINIAFTTPEYLVSIAINQKTEQQDGLNSNSIVSLALGQTGQKTSKFYYEFSEALYSMEVTEKYQEKHQVLKEYFGAYFNESSGEYEPMWNLSTRLKYLKFLLLGVDYSPLPNTYAMNDLIRDSIKVQYDEYADLLYVSAYTGSPEKLQILIQGLIVEADNFFKKSERGQINSRVDFLTTELSSTQSIAQRDALSDILQNQLLKKSLINTKELYKILIVRDIEISEYPVTPNIIFLLSLFFVMGLLLGIGYHSYRFLSQEIEWN